MNYRLHLASISAFISFFSITQSMEQSSIKHHLEECIGKTKSQLILDVGIGSSAGMVEVLCGGQALSFLKNHVQIYKPYYGEKLSWKSLNPRVWARGMSINLISMIPTTALQVGINGLLNSLYPVESIKEKMSHALVAGAISGIPSSFTELAIIQKQLKKTTVIQTLKHIFHYSFVRGINQTMCRDGIFAAGLFVLPNFYKKLCEDITHNQTLAESLRIPLAASTVLVLTQPLDRIKGALQGDIEKIRYRNGLQAVAWLWQEGGLQSLYAGGLWHGTRIASAITVISFVNKQLNELVN